MIDLFGEERALPAAALRPAAAPFQTDLIQTAAELAALASGRPVSQERARILADVDERDTAFPWVAA